MNNTVNPIKIAYADDHIAVRKGISAIIEEDENIKVVLEADNGQEMLEKLIATKTLPDICLIDIHMPLMNGHSLIRQIKSRWPELPCIVLSAFSEEYHIMAMIRAGARGYLLKSTPPKELIAAIKQVNDNGYYYNEVVISEKHLGNMLSKRSKAKPILLKEREVEFMNLICSDLNYHEIATKMGTTFKTIDGLRARLCEKFQVNSRVALVLIAIKMGYYVINTEDNVQYG